MCLIVIVLVIAVYFLIKKVSTATGAATYLTIYDSKFQETADIKQSTIFALTALKNSRAPFSELSDVDIKAIAASFSAMNLSGKRLSPLIVEADKERSIKRLADIEQIMLWVAHVVDSDSKQGHDK